MICAILLALQTQPLLQQSDARPLLDPMRPVQRIAQDSVTIQYFTQTPCESRVQVRQGNVPMTAWRPENMRRDPWTAPEARVAQGPAGKRTSHVVTITGLQPGKRYFYRVYDPDCKPTREERNWGASPPWRREYAFSTLAPTGQKTIIRLPVKVCLMPNVVNLESAKSGDGFAELPPLQTPEEIERIISEYKTASRFFWVNSGMRFWVDFHFFVDARRLRWGPVPEGAPESWKGIPECRSYAGVDFAGPGGGDFNILDTKDPQRTSGEPVYEESPYSGQIEQAFPRRWNPNAKRWEFYNSGGGTLGIDSFPQGVPGRSQFLGGGDTAWLVCHEFHHQMESYGAFALSNREDDRIVFNHYEPRRRIAKPDGSYEEAAWTTNGRHGEHWDGMAFWDRTLTDAQWLRMYFGYTETVKDADMDGFPDDDARLPLDEKRFGSDPNRSHTDGAMGDLQKVMLSTWVPSCLQQSWLKPEFQSHKVLATKRDNDDDGLEDSSDPYPLYPWQPFVWPAEASVDGDASEWTNVPVAGEASEGGLQYSFRHSHNEENYFGLVTISGNWSRFAISLDGEGKGVFSRDGVIGFEVRNPAAPEVRPTFGVAGLKWKHGKTADGRFVFEFSLPNRGEGLWYWTRGGREVGVSLDVFNEAGSGYSLYEPYRPVYFRMLEPSGQSPMPPGAPDELKPGPGVTELAPGDPRLKVQGGGWTLEGGVYVHSGDESALYMDVEPCAEFDLWIRFEARQDAILGAFNPATDRMGAGSDYILFVGGYANTVTRFRIFGQETADSDRMVTPGVHTLQLSRRGGRIWALLDGTPILSAKDPRPDAKVTRLAAIGGYGGAQKVQLIRYRVGN
ncbi:hypothetical protein FCG40_02135 [Fimbriimonadia bacterium ATM]|nr:MAG: hypothetical protein EDM73_09350 [Armatimonadota bacterium]MBC6970442.1 hypothetical protein [Armatimonadota bacterium]MCE7899695.1 hypothetical protein [Armatimonadetes bacterium ATM1]MDL1927780.1 hypothetical protein [Fimbriimonadia bacterium ATM]RIJ95316.1 MAG: hypothetical protein DCC45_10235 [Armatimonadota bacterium]